MADLTEKMKMMVTSKAELKELTCKITVYKDIPESFYGDSRRLLQAILNIAYNSIKYTFKGKVEITLKMAEGSAKKLEIIVEDTGIGVSAEDLERLNKLFGQLEKKITNNDTGIASLVLKINRNWTGAFCKQASNYSNEWGISTYITNWCRNKVHNDNSINCA